MVNWRELGEVPDSEDDDGFDSQESQPRPATDILPPKQPPLQPEERIATTTPQKDVWDIPSSQEDELAQAPEANRFQPRTARPSTPPPKSTQDTLDTDSPLSSLSLSPDLPPLEDVLQSPPPPPPSISRGHGENRDHGGSKASQNEPRSKTPILITSPPASPPRVSEDARVSTVQQGTPRQLLPFQSQILGHDTSHEEARRIAVSYKRSFRTRKPEQLRPYFTERARFNNEWKSHGLRPVRIATEDEEQRQRSKSPEETYEPASQESTLQRNSDESQQASTLEQLREAAGSPCSSSLPKTSPANHRGGPSSQLSQQTDDTSVLWDELPSIEELASKPLRQSSTKKLDKRKSSSLTQSSKAKRRKTQVASETPRSPGTATRFIMPPSSPVPAFSPPRPKSPDSDLERDPFISSDDDAGMPLDTMDFNNTPSKAFSVASKNPGADDDIRMVQSGGEAGGTNSSSDESSDSGSEVVHKNMKRIKGVLPASWLRLDQQYGRQKIQKNMKSTLRNPSPEREQRRGIAQRRFAKTASRAEDFLFDDSDDDTQPKAQRTTDDIFHNQTTLPIEPVPISHPVYDVSSDDDGSVIEEDHIDHMLPGIKRQMKLADSFGKAPKRIQSNSARKPEPGKAPRQPKITKAFGHTGSSARKTQATGRVQKRKSKKRSKQQSTVATIPKRRAAPHLSILDVIKPDAPRFLKIAARTVKKRPDQGRGSPGKKSIQLATRTDHVDAFSVLNDWRAGSIPQRSSVSSAKKARQSRPRAAEPLGERHVNLQPRQKHGLSSANGSRKLSRQVSIGGQVSYGSHGAAKSPQKAYQKKPGGDTNRQQMYKARPAQLEIEEGEPHRFAFHSGKKLLDRLYRNKYGNPSSIGSVFSEAISGIQPTNAGGLGDLTPDEHDEPAISPQRPKPAKTARRQRKPKPQQLDLEDPQYSHAHDPLPTVWTASPQTEVVAPAIADCKLQGLGPYGTTYTRHFEVFPLTSGVFFHDSTFIGSGAVDTAVNWALVDQGDTRPSMSFVLDEKVLYWGSWNAQVSSEFGIALDYVSEQLDRSGAPSEADVPRILAVPNQLLNYVMKRLTFDGDGDGTSFITRLLDALQSLNQRTKARLEVASSSESALLKIISKVYDRLVLLVFLAFKMCQADPAMLTEVFQVEELLKSVTKLAMQALHQGGMGQLRDLYKETSRVHVRERGLRDNAAAAESWVILMRTLEAAQIPRGSFWDLAQEVLVPSRITTNYDAHELERIWEDIFILLPLTEFDDTGVLIAGQRHEVAKDGWMIPSKLLKRVFELYRQDSRQSPSFNNYCRAILGRCHYLVEQWGWHKCSGIIGVVFDFFGSQNLAHLRNEEFYASPRFLEELAGQPSLSIEAEDRCFHIYLKLVALAIRKLAQAGSTKDIRNLVARTTPNHSRQFLKEQKIHERDLAALRNHHDLLVTLYWAAPLEHRPSVSLLERLVAPASSHKEACLINFRAWSQLARFIVAKGEATTTFKHFNQWRKEFFQQMMQQFNSVASDIQQQFLGLSTDVSKSISTDMINAMVAMNKTAIQDVLHYVVTASLDVMRHTPDLEAAVFCLSTPQLQPIFQHFASRSPELDWTMLRGCLAILGIFLTRVDEFKDSEGSQQSESQILNSAQADDALLTLNHDVAESYFAMARFVLLSCGDQGSNLSATVDKANCVEQVVMLAARLVVRFTQAGVMNVSDVFGRKKYGIFRDVPHKLSVGQRKYLTLFIATVLEYGPDVFDAADSCSLLELWTLALVKPRQSLAYENKLAQRLVCCNKPFVPEAAASLAITVDYRTNRDLFEFAISFMRKGVRDAGPSLKKILMTDYSKALKLVMEQIKADLRIVADEDKAEHPRYVGFIRNITALIRERGSEICAVDDFFYQINKEYSPSVEDPQLRVAGMMSYGLGLSEGDGGAYHQLFFFLYNNFKLGVISDKLDEEVRFLFRGMTNPAVFKFVIGKMVPAIVRAATMAADMAPLVLPLLDVYVQGLYLVLGEDVAPKQLCLNDCPEMLAAQRAVFDGLSGMSATVRRMHDEEILVAKQLFSLMNLMWPSVYAMVLNGDTDTGTDDSKAWEEMKKLLKYFHTFTQARETFLNDITSLEIGTVAGLDATFFLGLKRGDFDARVGTCSATAAAQRDKFVGSFAQSIVADVRKNWVIRGDRICIQAPGKVPGTQTQQLSSSSSAATSTLVSTQGDRGVQRAEQVDDMTLFRGLAGCLREWNSWHDKVFVAAEDKGEKLMEQKRRQRIEKTVRMLPHLF